MRVKSTAPELALEAVSARLSIAVRPTLSLHLTRYQSCPGGLSCFSLKPLLNTRSYFPVHVTWSQVVPAPAWDGSLF